MGNVAPLMEGFEEFRHPDTWELEDDKLLFLDENQGVCAWGVDSDRWVWMLTDDGFHPEQIQLADFLLTILPYQLAPGGWPHSSEKSVPPTETRSELARIATHLDWPLQADHNGLVIYGAGSSLLWALEPTTDDDTAWIFLSNSDANEHKKLTDDLGFSEL